jgi:hypothetical protein
MFHDCSLTCHCFVFDNRKNHLLRSPSHHLALLPLEMWFHIMSFVQVCVQSSESLVIFFSCFLIDLVDFLTHILNSAHLYTCVIHGIFSHWWLCCGWSACMVHPSKWLRRSCQECCPCQCASKMAFSAVLADVMVKFVYVHFDFRYHTWLVYIVFWLIWQDNDENMR